MTGSNIDSGFLFQALQFQRSLDEVEQLVVLAEKELTNEDCGADLPSVNRLLKALQGLEEKLDGHRDRIQVQRLHLCVGSRPACVQISVFSYCLFVSDLTDPDGNG